MQDSARENPPGADAGAALWNAVLATLRSHLSSRSYNEYMATSRPSYFDGRSLVVEVPSTYHRNWIIQNALDRIYEIIDIERSGDTISLELHVAPEGQVPVPNWERPNDTPSERVTRPLRPSDRDANFAEEEVKVARPRLAGRSGSMGRGGADGRPAGARLSTAARGTFSLNPRYTMENFVIGESNRFAHAAAQKAADPTSRQFSPLFIYGGVGLGKTHLMQAIGHQMLRHAPDKRVVYVTSEQFMNHFIDALSNGEQMEFRSLYRNVDLLLVDDVQFFVGKERTQTEFFYTFNELYEAGKKIVFSSDRSPKELNPLEERLRSRFEWGLTVDIQVPDLETRAAILQKKAAIEEIAIPQDVIFYVAGRIQSNVRELEGALQRLTAYGGLLQRPIDMEMAVDLLGHICLSPETPVEITVDHIIEHVCSYFKVSRDDLVGPSRVKKLSWPRHIAQYLSRNLTGLSFPEIGEQFGNRDHTSILHACRKIERELGTDARLANCVNFLTKQIRSGDGQNK